MTILLLLAGLVTAFLLIMQVSTWMRAQQAQGRPVPDTTAIDGAAARDRVRLYYFYSDHCGHCRSMTPLVERLQARHRNLIKLNIAEARELARALGAAATPCFVQVVDGFIRQVKLGSQSEARLRAMLQAPPD
jgi:thiol-disulfide isomerase/thioredoxin